MKNVYHRTNKQRLETALREMEHAHHNSTESSSCNREDSCSDKEAFGRAKDADGMKYAIEVIKAKIKTLKS
jgi:CRISPR/Cas system CSM-associated protein Csm3 (group 7 of RAMP superfamily)